VRGRSRCRGLTEGGKRRADQVNGKHTNIQANNKTHDTNRAAVANNDSWRRRGCVVDWVSVRVDGTICRLT